MQHTTRAPPTDNQPAGPAQDAAADADDGPLRAAVAAGMVTFVHRAAGRPDPAAAEGTSSLEQAAALEGLGENS